MSTTTQTPTFTIKVFKAKTTGFTVEIEDTLYPWDGPIAYGSGLTPTAAVTDAIAKVDFDFGLVDCGCAAFTNDQEPHTCGQG